MLVSICVCTCQRPQELMALLESLQCLQFKKVSPPTIEVIVIENNHSGVALTLCQELESTYAWKLIYAAEPEPGISYARNRSISLASSHTDFIVFVDDDEVVDPFWLDELLDAQGVYQADAVNGPVPSIFDTPVPKWVTDGKFFERVRYSTGTLRRTANTGNVLVRAAILRQLDSVFDNRFAFTGSEDHHLFTRLSRMGYRIIYTNLAIAYEQVPTSRVTVSYLLKRSFRVGYSLTLCELDFEPYKTRLLRPFKGIGRILQGCVQLPFTLFQQRHHQVHALQHIYYGAGMLTALFGGKYEGIYRQAHQATPSTPKVPPLSQAITDFEPIQVP